MKGKNKMKKNKIKTRPKPSKSPVDWGILLSYTEWILKKFYPDDHEDNLVDKAYSLVEQWEREREQND